MTSQNDLSGKSMMEILALYNQRCHEANLAESFQKSLLLCESAVYLSCIEDPDEQKMWSVMKEAHTYASECELIHRASNECEVCAKKLHILMQMLRAHLSNRLFTMSKSRFAQLRQDLSQTPQFRQVLSSKANHLPRHFSGASATSGESTSSEDSSCRSGTTETAATIMGSGLTDSSPAESNASQHSTGSNGHQSERCSTTTECFPRKVSEDVSEYLALADYMLEFTLLMENITSYKTEFPDFFASLDHEFGQFNPWKPIATVAPYILSGISRIHDHCPASSEGNSQ